MENSLIQILCLVVIIAIALLTLRHVRIINRQVDRIRDLADQEMTKKLVETTQQLEKLDQLYRETGLERGALPPTRGWAASPDFLYETYKLALAVRPRVVVELGSGTSSVIVGHALRTLGTGRLYSFDHDAHFLLKSQELIRNSGLEEFVSITHAPLGPVDLNGKTWQWYQIDDIPDEIDMLIVDGPPEETGDLARYPALPFFHDHLSNDAVIVFDDAIREQEQAMAARYLAELPSWEQEYIPLEKGMFVIRRHKSA